MVRRFALSFVVLVGCSSSGGSAAPASTDASPDASMDVAIDVAIDAHVHDVAVDVSEETNPYDGPMSLAETGLYADFAGKTLADGVLAYDVRFPLWSDGLEKSRFVWLPKGTSIDTTDADHWKFPVGTKVWKEFRSASRRIETRYLERRAGGWLRVTFGWDEAETSAKAMPAGAVDYGGTTHDLPDRDTCDRCHIGLPEGVLGMDAVQLAPSLDDWNARGMFSKPVLAKDPPGDGGVRDALAYLHGNCGPCHNDAGVWSKVTDLRLRIRSSDTTPASTGAYTTTLGKKAHHTMPGGIDTIIVAGDPDRSQLWNRMNHRDDWSMPPVGTEVIDDVGVATIRAWITGLP